MPGEYLQSSGEYLVVASKPTTGWFGQSKEKQTPYIQIRFTVEEGVDEGKEITWFGYLSEKAIYRTIEVLVAAFGFSGNLNDLYTGKITFDGMQARITTEIETYAGKDRCKVKWLNPAAYSGPPAIDDSTAKMLIAGLNNRAMAAAAAARASGLEPKNGGPSSVAKVSGESPEDDVPF